MRLVEQSLSVIEPPPPALRAESVLEQAHWALRALDIFHWLFIFMSKDGRGTLVPRNLALPIVRCNRALTALASETIKVVKKANPGVHYYDIDECLDRLLEEAGPPEYEDNDIFGVLKGKVGTLDAKDELRHSGP
ncbi:MAG: hypothetical protein H7Y88_12020 [Phycisphaerales bacterium]|nr:hypothetical protein [Phycisphaerales bacterium]